MKSLKYYLSKAIVYLQIPSIKGCKLHKTVKVGQRSNLLDVEIGKYTSVTIGGGVHPLDRISTSPLFYDAGNDWKTSRFISPDNAKIEQVKTNIGSDVWIGDNAYIKAGKTVGDGAIIGAGSVVTHDIPPYAIVAGVPAKVIRYRFPQDVIEKLLKSEWWAMDEDNLERMKNNFSKTVTNAIADDLLKSVAI